MLISDIKLEPNTDYSGKGKHVTKIGPFGGKMTMYLTFSFSTDEHLNIIECDVNAPDFPVIGDKYNFWMNELKYINIVTLKNDSKNMWIITESINKTTSHNDDVSLDPESIGKEGQEYWAKAIEVDKKSIFGAAARGEIKVVKGAIESEFDINSCDDEGNPLLHMPILGRINHQNMEEKSDTLIYLLKAGVNINSKDSKGWTALSTACDGEDIEMVKILLNNRADIHSTDNKGWTPLHNAANKGNVEIIQLLINNGANTDAQSTQKYTPLLISVAKGFPNAVEILLKHGANMELKRSDSLAPLHIAALQNDFDSVKLLIEYKANLHIKEINEATPLHAAALKGNLRIAELLLKNGADSHITDKKGLTPIDLAKRSNNFELMHLFKK